MSDGIRLVNRVRREAQFINPYTFVPFFDPDDIMRDGPAGHCLLAADRYSGEISVTACAQTRVAVVLVLGGSVREPLSGVMPT